MAKGSAEDLVVTLTLADEFTAGLRKAVRFTRTATKNLGKAFRSVTKTVFSLQGAILGLATGVAVRSFLTAFAEQEQAAQNLANAMRLTGTFTQRAFDDFQEFATGLQKVTTTGDEATLQFLALAQSMGLTREQSKALVVASVDLAAATGKSVDAAFAQLLKTIGGFAGELGEIIPELKTLTAEQLKTGRAIDLVGQKFAGFARAQVKTTAGAIKQTSDAFGDLREEFGRFIAAVLTEGKVLEGLKIFFEDLGKDLSELEFDAESAKAWGREILNVFETALLGGALLLDGFNAIQISLDSLNPESARFQISSLTQQIDLLAIGMDEGGDAMRRLTPPTLVLRMAQLVGATREARDAGESWTNALGRVRGALLEQQRLLIETSGPLTELTSKYETLKTRLAALNERLAGSKKKTAEQTEEQGVAIISAAEWDATVRSLNEAFEEQQRRLAAAGTVTMEANNAYNTFLETQRDLDRMIAKSNEQIGRQGLMFQDATTHVVGYFSALEQFKQTPSAVGKSMLALDVATERVNRTLTNEAVFDEAVGLWEGFLQETSSLTILATKFQISAIRQVSDAVADIFGRVLDAAFEGQIRNIRDVGRIVVDVINDMVKQMIQQLIRIAVQTAITKSVAGFAEGGIIEGGFIPMAAATPMAHGGVFDQPTFGLIGEAGPEAAVPLTRGREIPVEIRGSGGTAPGGVTVNMMVNAIDVQDFAAHLSKPQTRRVLEGLIADTVREDASFRSEIQGIP